MKYLYLLIILLLTFACQAKKELITEKKEVSMDQNCPEDGTCTFEVLENKSLNIMVDGTGALYPEIIEGQKTILKFEYKRREIAGTADSNYAEIIYAEIDSDAKPKTWRDEELSLNKVVFGRLCFCRGKTGYYNIKEGTMSISKTNNSKRFFEFRFKINEVPQIINSISEYF